MAYLIFLEVNFMVKYDGGLLNVWIHMLMLTANFSLSHRPTNSLILIDCLTYKAKIQHLLKNAILSP